MDLLGRSGGAGLRVHAKVDQAALVTLPALMHRVQTSMRLLRAPFTSARIFWRLGSVRFLVLLLAWLTLLPTRGRFPHTSQTKAMTSNSLKTGRFCYRPEKGGGTYQKTTEREALRSTVSASGDPSCAGRPGPDARPGLPPG